MGEKKFDIMKLLIGAVTSVGIVISALCRWSAVCR